MPRLFDSSELKRLFDLALREAPVLYEIAREERLARGETDADKSAAPDLIIVGLYIAVAACKILGLDESHKQLFLDAAGQIWDKVRKPEQKYFSKGGIA